MAPTGRLSSIEVFPRDLVSCVTRIELRGSNTSYFPRYHFVLFGGSVPDLWHYRYGRDVPSIIGTAPIATAEERRTESIREMRIASS